jgi:hypothetical protein
MRIIPLTQDQVTLVDDEDYKHLSQFKWCAHWNSGTRSFYAVRSGKRETIRMSRVLMGCEKGDKTHVDHINHDTLDNRRENLRCVTCRQNHENMRNQSKYGVGIRHQKGKNPYRAEAYAGGRIQHIGMFATSEEAIQARKEFLKGIEK